MSTVNCRDCIKNYKHFCWDDLWARAEDEFLKDDKDFEQFITKEKFCSEFEPNADTEKEALYQAEEEHRVT